MSAVKTQSLLAVLLVVSAMLHGITGDVVVAGGRVFYQRDTPDLDVMVMPNALLNRGLVGTNALLNPGIVGAHPLMGNLPVLPTAGMPIVRRHVIGPTGLRTILSTPYVGPLYG